jgi:hypothetical protein
LIFLVWSHKRKNPQAARQSYIGSTTLSSTVDPSGDSSGMKFVFPSPKPPPWDWGSTHRYNTGLIEMVCETANSFPSNHIRGFRYGRSPFELMV